MDHLYVRGWFYALCHPAFCFSFFGVCIFFSLTDDFLNISSCFIADLSLQTHSPPYSLDSRAEIVTNKDKDPTPALKVAQRLATDSGPNHAPLPLTMFPAPSQF